MSMTVRELIEELERVENKDAKVTVDSQHQGEGVFNHSIQADDDLVASWDVDDSDDDD